MSAPFNTAHSLALDVLAATLTSVSEAYLRLLSQPDSLELCTEVGKSHRRIARCYSNALIAVVNAQAESEADDNEWDNAGDPLDE